MIKQFKQSFAVLLFMLPLFGSQANAMPITQEQEYEFTHVKHVLNTHPEREDYDSVGSIMYKTQNNRVYILLGRENLKIKDKMRAGKFCTLGGYAKQDLTYVESMRRALEEESLGLIHPSTQYITDNSAFLVKKAPGQKKDAPRKIMYALIPAGANYYIPAPSMNQLRQKQIASLPSAEETKDLFAWLDVEELIDGVNKRAMIISVHDVDGQLHKVKLPRFFINDFIKHPDLKLMLNKIKTQSFVTYQ